MATLSLFSLCTVAPPLFKSFSRDFSPFPVKVSFENSSNFCIGPNKSIGHNNKNCVNMDGKLVWQLVRTEAQKILYLCWHHWAPNIILCPLIKGHVYRGHTKDFGCYIVAIGLKAHMLVPLGLIGTYNFFVRSAHNICSEMFFLLILAIVRLLNVRQKCVWFQF